MVELANFRLLDSFGCKGGAKAKLAMCWVCQYAGLIVEEAVCSKSGMKARQKGRVWVSMEEKVGGGVNETDQSTRWCLACLCLACAGPRIV